MKYFFYNTETTVDVSTTGELVEWMRLNDIENCRNNKEFMHQYAARKWNFGRFLINPASEDEFTDSLIENGIIARKPRINHYLNTLLKKVI